MIDLTKKDYENINKLIEISKQINSIYDELYELEVNGKKNTKEFISVISKLKTTLNIENNIYASFTNSFERLNLILQFLTENTSISDLNIFNETEDLVLNRIYLKFNDILINGSYFECSEDSELINNLRNNAFGLFIRSVKIKDSVIEDLNRLLLVIIEKEIAQNDNKYLRKLKYEISYVYPGLEKVFLKNNFTIDEQPYVETIFLGQLNGYSTDDIHDIIDLYCKDFYNEILIKMLSFEDEELKDDIAMAQVLAGQSFLRAIFLLIDDKTIKILNDSFNILINEQEMQSIFNVRKMIIAIINESYRNVISDKSIPKIISLKL